MKKNLTKWLMYMSTTALMAFQSLSACDLSGFTLNSVTSLGNNKYKINVTFCAGGGRSNTRYGADQSTTNFAFYMSQNATVDTFGSLFLKSPMTGDTLWGMKMVDDSKLSVAYDASVLYYLSPEWNKVWACISTTCGTVQSVCGTIDIVTNGLPDTIWCRGMEAAGNILGGCTNLKVFPRCYQTTINASAGSNATVYPGGSPACATLTGSATGGTGSYTYLWSTGATTASISVCPTATKIYSVKISDGWGCNATSNVTVSTSCAQSTLAVNGGSDKKVYRGYNPTCATLTASASGGSGSYTYLWSNAVASASTTVCPTQTTDYTITAKDGYGCTATDVVNVKYVDVRCGTGLTKVSVCSGGKTRCISSSQVQSYLNNGATLGACGSTPAPLGTGFTGADFMDFSVYPNPASNDFTVKTGLQGKITIQLFNIEGQLVKSLYSGSNTSGDEMTISLNIEGISNGIYLLKAQGFDGEGMPATRSMRLGIQ